MRSVVCAALYSRSFTLMGAEKLFVLSSQVEIYKVDTLIDISNYIIIEYIININSIAYDYCINYVIIKMNFRPIGIGPDLPHNVIID